MGSIGGEGGERKCCTGQMELENGREGEGEKLKDILERRRKRLINSSP